MKTLAELVADHETLTKALGLTKIETAQERTALCDDNDGYAWETVPKYLSLRNLGDRVLISGVWEEDIDGPAVHQMVVIMGDETMEVWCEFNTVTEYK